MDDPLKIYEKVNKELTKVKHACFGKIKVSNKSDKMKELERLQREKIEVMNSNNVLLIQAGLEICLLYCDHVCASCHQDPPSFLFL